MPRVRRPRLCRDYRRAEPVPTPCCTAWNASPVSTRRHRIPLLTVALIRSQGSMNQRGLAQSSLP